MSRRVVTLGDGRRVTLGAYVRAWRTVRAADPAALFRGSPCGDWRIPETAGESLRQFRAGMVDRINRHLPSYGRGRKWRDDWQHRARDVAWRMRARVVTRIADCPRELRARLDHRLYGPDDF